VTAFWRAQGVTTKNQLSKLTLLASSRKLYCDLERIAEKLDQVRTCNRRPCTGAAASPLAPPKIVH
jgi:hypothetical protein